MQPPLAATVPGAPGSAPGPGPALPDSPVLRRCHRASPIAVLVGLIIDSLIIVAPLTAGLVPSLPRGARLALVLISLVALVLVMTGHALRGRSLGGVILGLRGVDVDAGLPPASLRSVLAVLQLGSAADVLIISTRRGPDPTRGSLVDLERTATAPPLAPGAAPAAPHRTPPPRGAVPRPAPPPTSRPVPTPMPAAERPVAASPPAPPAPDTGRASSLPPSIPVRQSHPPARGPQPAPRHSPPRQPSDTVEIRPVHAAPPRPGTGDVPPAPPPPAPPSRRAR